MTESSFDREAAAAYLTSALTRERFLLYCQPIVQVDEPHADQGFFEVLVRFRDEEEGLLPPGSFIPVLRDAGLMPLLDRWVVSTAIRKLRGVAQGSGIALRFSINLSAEALVDATFPEFVAAELGGRTELAQRLMRLADQAGARVRVHLTMVADNRRYHVALVDPLPAGLEILLLPARSRKAINPDLAVSGSLPQDPAVTGYRYGWWWGPWYEHQNLRDERAEAFTSLLWDGGYQYSYTARATTPGTFVVPPAKAEEMYSPEVFGRSSSDVVYIQ